MEYRKLGSSELKASAVALGTWAVGGGPFWGASDDRESIKAIHAALDAGINLIDTAPVYGFGHSEEIVGKALIGHRDKAVIATKCGLWWGDETGVPFFTQMGHTARKTLDPRTVRLEVENSLRRLQTDYIDVMQTHWQAVEPFKTPIADTVNCLMKLKAEGKIRAIGASNISPAQMDEYRQVGPLDVCQPKYSMLARGIEADALPYCIEHHIAILAYSPLEQGLLTGKIGMDATFTKEEFRNFIPWFQPDKRKKVLDMLAGWKDLTDKYRCTLGQLVIAWTIAQPGITCALVGARKTANVLENAGGGNIVMEKPDIERMRANAEALGK